MVDYEWVYTGGVIIWLTCYGCGEIISNIKINDIDILARQSLDDIAEGLPKKSLCVLCED